VQFLLVADRVPAIQYVNQNRQRSNHLEEEAMEQYEDLGAVFSACGVRRSRYRRDNGDYDWRSYVTHVPVMTGGCGADDVRRFYSPYFIDHWSADTQLKPISRTDAAGKLRGREYSG
jgi:hypothetical protein